MMQAVLLLLISFSGNIHKIQSSVTSKEKTNKFFPDFGSCLPIWMRTYLGEILALKSLRVLVQWSLNIPCM